jgi:predicted protein tyrosine phosphatase
MKEKREKNWKLLYLRSDKLHRAQQLGFEYPIGRELQILSESLNVLFVCSRNQWRSPTAENMYKNRSMLQVRSAGTSTSARRKVSATDIKWADVIIVMEDKHRSRILAEYPGESKYKEMHVLNIEDNYKYMDKELIAELIELVDPIIYDRKSV